MYEKLFNIDLKAYVRNLIPVELRGAKMLAWMYFLSGAFRPLFGQFRNYRRDSLYKIQHTGQVFSLEKVLNDHFDRAGRNIYLRDGEYILPNYFYEPPEDKPVRFYEDEGVRFYEPTQNLDVDFEVVLPAYLSLTEAQLFRVRALINFYKLADKTYSISYE